MQSPLDKYPKPPFKSETQSWPGLAARMDPKPGHGEQSYRGSGRLAGRKALITWGDSGMGRAAAIAYAREGADVAINYFPSEEPDAREVIELIREAGRRGVAISGDLREELFCQRVVAETVQKLGGLDILVCNAGRQQSRASILELTSDDFDATMKTNIYAPLLDHQSCTAASEAWIVHHRDDVGAGLRIPAPIFATMRRQRRQR